MLYIALLRGINVGGHNVKMDVLRQHFTDLGFGNVRTYIQSGNVFFETDETDREALAKRIEDHLHEALGYEVPTFLRTADELEAILALDPFKGLDVNDDLRLAITFTTDPIAGLSVPAKSPKGDMEIVHATDHEAFVVWTIINGRPPAGNWLDKTVGKRTTTRFFHTTGKILEAARGE